MYFSICIITYDMCTCVPDTPEKSLPLWICRPQLTSCLQKIHKVHIDWLRLSATVYTKSYLNVCMHVCVGDKHRDWSSRNDEDCWSVQHRRVRLGCTLKCLTPTGMAMPKVAVSSSTSLQLCRLRCSSYIIISRGNLVPFCCCLFVCQELSLFLMNMRHRSSVDGINWSEIAFLFIFI